MPRDTYAIGPATVQIIPKHGDGDYHLEYDIESCSVDIECEVMESISKGIKPDESMIVEAAAQLEMGGQKNLRMIIMEDPSITDRMADILTITRKKMVRHLKRKGWM